MDLNHKMKRLEDILKGYGTLLVAFSGGVDSAFLLAIARKVLNDQVVAVTGDSAIHPKREKKAAVSLAKKLNVRHIVHLTSEMELTEFLNNPDNRCYICKQNLISDLKKLAKSFGIAHIAHGANVDDLDDYRPGFIAAEEMGVLAPLIEAGLTKSEIRTLSKTINLETWDKPSMPCLATRIPYGTPITEATIRQIDKAENVLFNLGINVFRVRHHQDLARIETDPENFKLLMQNDIRVEIVNAFKKLGYLYVSLDMEGYVSGSMNQSIDRTFK